jgi:hypothetical protein
MSISCQCFVLSGRGLCDGPIPRPQEFSTGCGVSLRAIQKLQQRGDPGRVRLLRQRGEGGESVQHNIGLSVIKVYLLLSSKITHKGNDCHRPTDLTTASTLNLEYFLMSSTHAQGTKQLLCRALIRNKSVESASDVHQGT